MLLALQLQRGDEACQPTAGFLEEGAQPLGLGDHFGDAGTLGLRRRALIRRPASGSLSDARRIAERDDLVLLKSVKRKAGIAGRSTGYATD